MKRILQIYSRYLERGGEDVVIDQISQRLHPHFELQNWELDTQKWMNECGSGLPGKWAMLRTMRNNPKIIQECKRRLEEFHPDVILTHNLMPAGSANLLKILVESKIPVVQYIHNFRPFSISGYCWVNGKLNDSGLRGNMLPEILSGSWQGSILKTAYYATLLHRQLKDKVYDNISHWIAISPFMKEKFIEAGIAENKISVVPHILETPLQVTTENKPTPKELQYFLYMGRLTEPKGIMSALDAWSKINNRTSNTKFLIAGDGPLKEKVIEATKRDNSISYIGYAQGKNREELLSNATAMIVPSLWWEAFGLVVYDAYLHSIPVLAAKSGALPDLIIENKTGWLHEPGNSTELAKQISVLIEKPELAKSAGIAGKEFLETHSRPEIWLNQFGDCLNTVLESSAKTHSTP